MVTKTVTPFRPGTRVLVPWGLGEARQGVVVEVWGSEGAPTHVRVQMSGDDGEGAVLLLKPALVEVAT
jgi:primosomal protein N'